MIAAMAMLEMDVAPPTSPVTAASPIEDILANVEMEERIYRFRCVEAWSMVIPWNGFELADLLNQAGVQESARYVALETVLRPDEMPGVSYPIIDWPYKEGLRLDEAMHPLTIMATGLYDEPMPNQNAPSNGSLIRGTSCSPSIAVMMSYCSRPASSAGRPS